jgi:hypothetical protein
MIRMATGLSIFAVSVCFCRRIEVVLVGCLTQKTEVRVLIDEFGKVRDKAIDASGDCGYAKDWNVAAKLCQSTKRDIPEDDCQYSLFESVRVLEFEKESPI